MAGYIKPTSSPKTLPAMADPTLSARKPDPAPLLYAAGKLGLQPAECIYIGDAERDVLAARAAGMQVYVAMFGYIPAHEQPREWPATGWLEDPQAVAQLLDSLTAPSPH